MPATVKSVIVSGVGGTPIDIECHLSNGLPNIVIVGIASKAVDEAKERIKSAYQNSGLKLPRKRITINLAPADIPKEGSGYDLPIAISILIASEAVKKRSGSSEMMFGELGLDGKVRPIRGVIGKILAGKKLGAKIFWIPEENIRQAMLVPDVEIVPLKSLGEAYRLLNQTSVNSISTGKGSYSQLVSKPRDEFNDFKYIVGQPQAKRALEIAAAGHHNILLSGPPGVGKSIMAKAMVSIMPPLNHREMVEATHIHSLAGKSFQEIITAPPFRSPHHSSSDISIIGGGQSPRPGEISLSHNGVLFLDELPEFSRSTIEALRQPLEERIITVARAKETLEFPSRFILVATQNPCPCGHFGTNKACTCLPQQIMKYQKKISGPILDRIDLFANVGNIASDTILSKIGSEEPSKLIIKRVINARNRQLKRQNKLNSELSGHEIKKIVKLDEPGKQLLDRAALKFELSARAYMRVIKLARTIADLDNSDDVVVNHISEALQYRHQQSEII